MTKLILVHHPNTEPDYQNNSPVQIIHWNSGNHKRKFIRHDGVYLDKSNNSINYAPLYFWGEYEPYSCAHCFNDAPAIHDDLKSVRNVNVTPVANMLNTDPYVFGSRFRYICCKKTGQLNPDDVVLFGNYDSSGKFFFDTVFVCKKENYNVAPDFEDQYYGAGIRTSGKKHFSEGKMYRDGERYFSFVPCRVGDWNSDKVEKEKRFTYSELPYLEVNELGLKEINIRNKNILEFRPFIWDKILEAVRDANMFIGIHLAEI